MLTKQKQSGKMQHVQGLQLLIVSHCSSEELTAGGVPEK